MKKPQLLPLFKEMMPFGGKLDEDNFWIKSSELVPWDELGELHDSYFCKDSLPRVKKSRLILGLLIGKTKMGLSDVEILNYFYENPYFQYFCGMDSFVTRAMTKILNDSLLSKRRKKLGAEYFVKFEQEIFKALKARNLLKGKNLLLDATVFPSNITYPNDVKLLNTVREWCCGKITKFSEALGNTKFIRMYNRVAKKTYLNFAKKKKKSGQLIRKSRRQMLNFVNRNLNQLSDLVTQAKSKLESNNFELSALSSKLSNLLKEVDTKMITAKEIYAQQKQMHDDKVSSTKDRILSFHEPHVRPIVRGKSGNKYEFGAKAHISSTDGYAFIDKIEHSAFSEKTELENSLEIHKDKFGKYPKTVAIDDAYSSRLNRSFLKENEIYHSLKLIGKVSCSKEKAKKRKLRKSRSKIEGVIGNIKKDYSLARIILKTKEGAEIQARIGVSCFNLNKALANI